LAASRRRWNRTHPTHLGELEQLLRSRQEREVFRDKQGPDDGLGQVFLVIDNLYAFSRDNTDQFNTRNPLLEQGEPNW